MAGMRRIRLRIGLRLLLILVALACVLSAYGRAYLNLRREEAKTRIFALERDLSFESHIGHTAQGTPTSKAYVARTKAELARARKIAGSE
jgi:hypothetical protein